MPSESFERKCLEIKNKFLHLPQDEKYNLLMQMGKDLPPLSEEKKTPQNLVSGCQSILYLHTSKKNGEIFFEAHADALISSGLAAILIAVYSGETAETILTSPPCFLSEIGIIESLSPNRSSGLANIHLKMKKDALKAII